MDENFEKPPTNRAQAWFRVMLWILPAGFAVASGIGVDRLKDAYFPTQAPVGTMIWFVLNFIFVIGSGWFDSQLSVRARSEVGGSADRIMRFFLLQLFLIPFLSLAFLFFACLIDPIKF
jgi:uncharacterized membrane protein